MARSCYICGKKPTRGRKILRTGTGKWIKKRVSRRRYPNLQKVTFLENGQKKKVLVCTKCLKRLQKEEKTALANSSVSS